MKTIIKIALIFAAVPLVFSSCRVVENIDPDLEIRDIGGTTYAQTELDEWLEKAFLIPYNIEVIYRWDAVKFYNGVTKKLIPAQVEKVKPMMSTVAKIWFDPYLYAAGYGFLQKYTPKTVVLSGSPEYAADGSSMVLGTAEGAVKIFLTNVNSFNPSNRAVLKNYLHVIEHEFVHVLNQAVNYDEEFRSLTAEYYDPTGWTGYEYDNSEAYARGFLSNYSMSAPDEDFAEVMSLMLINGVEWFENEVIPMAEASEVNLNAANALRRKVAIVEEYLRDEFDIALFDDTVTGKKGFITAVQDAINYVIDNADYYLSL